MERIKTKLPLYLGVFILIISVLTVSVKVGEKTIMQTGLIKASEARGEIKLSLTNPNIISLNLFSSNEVGGGDFVLTYNPDDLEILPSTLSGQGGYVTTGGEVDNQNGIFSFSLLNSENPVKTGILATFQVKIKSKVKIDFDAQLSRLVSANSEKMLTKYQGIK